MADSGIKSTGQSFSTDDIGVTTWRCSYYVASEADYHTAGETPPADGLVEVSREGRDKVGLGEGDGKEGMMIDVTYEGIISNDHAGVDNARVEIDASYSEEILTSHPNWLSIKENFLGRYDEETGRVVFTETIPFDAQGAINRTTWGLGGPATGSRDDLQKNPMFGEETYLLQGVVFRRTWATNKLPAELIAATGKIQEALPAPYSDIGEDEGRNWIQQPPKIQRRGGCFVVTDELLQSGLTPWNEQLYEITNIT